MHLLKDCAMIHPLILFRLFDNLSYKKLQVYTVGSHQFLFLKIFTSYDSIILFCDQGYVPKY